jgi:hypothetical protein
LQPKDRLLKITPNEKRQTDGGREKIINATNMRRRRRRRNDGDEFINSEVVSRYQFHESF